jgi:hypothetical protein
MHTQELVITHALGIRTRSRRKVVIDSFPLGKRLRDNVRTLLSYIMDRKAKGRFKEYSAFCDDNCGTKGLVLELPNDTRVAGTYRMLLSCLRSKIPITLFCTNSGHSEYIQKNNMQLTRPDWALISEFESILKVCHDLALQSQVDEVGSNCYSYYAVRHCRNILSNSRIFEFIDVNANYSPDVTRKHLPKIQCDRADISKESSELLDRLELEFERYFAKPDRDQLLAMFFHPMFVFNGYK